MATDIGNGKNSEPKGKAAKDKVENDIDALFALPLAEFTSARNALAARLKQSGHPGDAERVKALGKPPISAWAVNQLYWKHRKAFDNLITTSQRFRQAQASQLAGKTADLREAGDGRRAALSELSRLAAALLRDGGHNATQETMRRITTTLEAISAYASLPGAPPTGRLTDDLDPPGFDALASLIPAAATTERKEPTVGDNREVKTTREAIAAAKVSLREAERMLKEARAKAEDLEADRKKAAAVAKEAEKLKREADARFEQAKADADDAAKAVENAARTVDKLSKELQSLLQSSRK